MKSGELRCSGFSHVWNRESEKPARERQSSGALDRVNRLGGIFLAQDTRDVLGAEI